MSLDGCAELATAPTLDLGAADRVLAIVFVAAVPAIGALARPWRREGVGSHDVRLCPGGGQVCYVC